MFGGSGGRQLLEIIITAFHDQRVLDVPAADNCPAPHSTHATFNSLPIWTWRRWSGTVRMFWVRSWDTVTICCSYIINGHGASVYDYGGTLYRLQSKPTLDGYWTVYWTELPLGRVQIVHRDMSGICKHDDKWPCTGPTKHTHRIRSRTTDDDDGRANERTKVQSFQTEQRRQQQQ